MSKKGLLITLVFLLLLAACEPEPDLSNFSSTKDPASLRPALFKPEDLDWPLETYQELTTYVWVREDRVPTEDQMAASMKAKPTPSTRGPTPTNMYGAHQIVYSYGDEATAIQAFAQVAEDYIVGMGPFPEGVYFVPRLNNMVTGCRGSYSPEEIGNYRTCEFVAQHGRYVTTASMNVDGQVIQMQDWEDLLNAIQDRLIAHVEQEDSSQ